MSTYQGRHGPNFSEYLNNLNTLSPQDENFNDNLDINADLAMFTNTDFTNFDNLSLPEDMNFDLNNDKPEEVKYGDLLAGADTQAFGGPLNQASPDTSHFYPNYNTPIQPAPPQAFSPTERGMSGSRSRTDELEQQGLSPDEKSRLAAEEDKRRRNTAASARFRVKKKQREAALERSVKDTNEKNTKLEAKVNQLEMENKWLKDLLTEKHAVQSKEEIDVAYQKFKRESEEREDRHTTGVGTE